MHRFCPTCSTEVPDASRYCGGCGRSLAPGGLEADTLWLGAAETAIAAVAPRSRPLGTSTSAADEEGRFPPGTMLAQRYRIAGLLGRGGMGEVYKATDLLVGQTVALKLLPDALASNPAALERFRNEVRVARRVSHPNVCRVHDIGEAGGQVFLTMEYADGEDLQSLLRRIGGLPVPKALDIARRICHGLAAAHDKGVLHRDLKPANILIDGQGNVLISDFGLAALATALGPEDARHGTPAYMAPEQLTGLEVTARSDIYALGLLLYETFAGRRPYEANSWEEMTRMEEAASPPPLSNFVKDLDPAVERIIRQCLAADPAQRPASALAVAAALPGGDALAAALAAGQTPSPELVAAAGEKAAMRRAPALILLLAVAAGLVALAAISGRIMLLAHAASDYPPEALAAKARETLRGFGYRAAYPAAHSSLRYATRPPVFFHYRAARAEAPAAGPALPFSQAAWQAAPGEVEMDLDMAGHLLRFRASPDDADGAAAPYDFARLLQAAGLDAGQLAPGTPQRTPPSAFDQRVAWLAGGRRVEAAAWRGRPVYFALEGAGESDAATAGDVMGIATNFAIPLAVLTLLGGAFLAWRNWRSARGDRRGAFRVGAFVGLTSFLAWLLADFHAADALLAAAPSLYLGVWAGLLYLGLEPTVRRRWPLALVSWSRLLAGEWRDPLVGRHVLIGLAGGVALSLLYRAHGLLYGAGAADARAALLPLAFGGTALAAGLLYSAELSLLRASGMLLAAAMLSPVCRGRATAIGGLALVLAAGFGAASAQPWLSGPFFFVVAAAALWFVTEYGLLAGTAMLFCGQVVATYPMTLDTAAWFFTPGAFGILALLALAVGACRQAMARG